MSPPWVTVDLDEAVQTSQSINSPTHLTKMRTLHHPRELLRREHRKHITENRSQHRDLARINLIRIHIRDRARRSPRRIARQAHIDEAEAEAELSFGAHREVLQHEPDPDAVVGVGEPEGGGGEAAD